MASKKLRAQNANQGDELSVDMSPMIDMVFLLLIFFIVTANLVVVKMDKRVEVPVAENSSPQEKKTGRIVINVYGDGGREDGVRYSMGDGDFTPIADDDAAIREYIEEQKNKMDGTVKPQLHLRGHRNTEFKHCQRVIALAAEVGVDQVVFASYATAKAYAN
ncbi:ExbD/TolR family protein [Roseibacillus ishigakijimensis]|uniref:Biopolymer transporter ExbD n=1 Tax=Roseibacillus ishigakijimensis TaxID=454146 RepID=A0A934RKT9_9BACT|nr:biopolymer transporter ExbD [Roseibacillus ishigakijimensis]MBK1832570.1 biopolymer transporter ExbD [Roseibacillus ishigakijimensis]